MSPERILGQGYLSDIDIWSLALTLVQCATGRFPYPDEADAVSALGFWELKQYIVEKPSPSLPKNAGFSQEFHDFLAICLRKTSGTRSTARQLVEHPFCLKYMNLGEDHLKRWIKSIE